MKYFVLLCLLHVVLTLISELKQASRKMMDVDSTFMGDYERLLANITEMDSEELGQMICLTGKMHLFGLFGQPDYLKAYFYIKIAAEYFEVPDCYYHLGLMYNYKLSPQFTIGMNLELKNNLTTAEISLLRLTSTMHLTHSQLMLYIASMHEHPSAMMVLANQNWKGISMKNNCTAAALYYADLVKKIYVEEFLDHSYYREKIAFEEELYLRELIDPETLIESEVGIVEETTVLGIESYLANFEIAQNYFYGRRGFRRNYTKAAEMFEKLQSYNNMETTLLGMCYFKGLGVEKDYKKAKELFEKSNKMELSLFMLAIMEYYGIETNRDKVAAINKMNKLSSSNPQAKAFLGSLMLRGEIKGYTYKDGLNNLESAALKGNQHAKLIMGMQYLDGTIFRYSCEKAIPYLFEALIMTDEWWDRIEQAKRALYMKQWPVALMKYLEIGLMGDSVGLINGIYMLDVMKKGLQLNKNTWDYKRILKDEFYQKILKITRSFTNVETILFGDYLKFTDSKSLRKMTEITPKTEEALIQSVRTKLLAICRKIDESICKFIIYKDKNDLATLKELANDNNGKLHTRQARYLMGKVYQDANKTQQAKGMYRYATGSGLLAELIYQIEGGTVDLGILNDFFVFASIIVVVVGIAVVHRNMVLIKLHEKHLEKEAREKENVNKEQGMAEQPTEEKPMAETRENLPYTEESSDWLHEKQE